MTAIRLMKAYTLDLSESNKPAELLTYPQLLSVKLHGVRAGASSKGLFSNSGKYFPNTLLQERFSMLRDLDMELINGDPVAYNVFGHWALTDEQIASLITDIVKECSRVAKLATGDNKVCDAIEQHFGIE